MVKKSLFLNIFIVLSVFSSGFSMGQAPQIGSSSQNSSSDSDPEESRVSGFRTPTGSPIKRKEPKDKYSSELPTKKPKSSEEWAQTPQARTPKKQNPSSGSDTFNLSAFNQLSPFKSPVRKSKFFATSSAENSPKKSPEKHSGRIDEESQEDWQAQFASDVQQVSFSPEKKSSPESKESQRVAQSCKKKNRLKLHGRKISFGSSADLSDTKEVPSAALSSIVESVEEPQVRYDEAFKLIQNNLKETFLLPYEFKDTLFLAKQMARLCHVQTTGYENTILDSIVLINDDHILNLVYEEKPHTSEKTTEKFHLAGGHFNSESQSVSVLNKVASMQGFEMKACVKQIAHYPLFGIRYVQYTVTPSIGLKNCISLAKPATLFPNSIKSNFYSYIRTLFNATNAQTSTQFVDCLDTKNSGNKTTYLLRHNLSFFNNFSSESIALLGYDCPVYVHLVVYEEDGVRVIWTCFLLGVYVVDWSNIETQMSEDEVEIYQDGNLITKLKSDTVKQKIICAWNEACTRSQCAKKAHKKTLAVKTKYMFEEHEVRYLLIDLENGFYLKIKSDDVKDVAESYKSEMFRKGGVTQKKLGKKAEVKVNQAPQATQKP